MTEQSPLERAARALAESLERRPYGGYDYGHNEAFYGPAPEAGRYVVRCEKTDKIVHQTNDEAAHNAAYELLTNTFHARAVLMALREPSVEMVNEGVDAHFIGSWTDGVDPEAVWQAMIDEALEGNS
jgi:hypothetical protein